MDWKEFRDQAEVVERVTRAEPNIAQVKALVLIAHMLFDISIEIERLKNAVEEHRC